MQDQVLPGRDHVREGRRALEVRDEHYDCQREERALYAELAKVCTAEGMHGGEAYERNVHVYGLVGQEPTHECTLAGHHRGVLLGLLNSLLFC